MMTTGRPLECPVCESAILQRWGKVPKSLNSGQDIIQISRFRCTVCGSTFRHYPEGFDQSKYSISIRRMAAVFWLLGLSYREAASLFGELGIQISHTTIWREGRELSSAINCTKGDFIKQIYSLDKEYIHKISSKLGVVVAVDMGGDQLKVLGTLDEYNPREVFSSLELTLEGTDVDLVLFGTNFLNSERVCA